MIRIAVLGLCLVTISQAQQLSIAANADGSEFHFVTALALKGDAAPFPGSRVYAYGETPRVVASPDGSLQLLTPVLFTDSRTEAKYYFLPCFHGSCGFSWPNHVVDIKRNGAATRFTGGPFRFSRNGRFIYDSGAATAKLTDLDTGTQQTVRSFPKVHERHAITDDGTLLSIESKVTLTPFGKPSDVLFEGSNVTTAAITPGGRIAFIVQQPSDKWYRLFELDVSTRQQTTLWEGPINPGTIDLSAEGDRVMMIWPNQLLLWDRASNWKSLFTHEEGISEALLADNGKSVFAITGLGRYYRIDVDSGDTIELYAPMPTSASQGSAGAYPGSVVRLRMNRIAAGATYKIGDYTLPIAGESKDYVDVQLPFEATDLVGQQAVVEVTREDSPFALRAPVQINREPNPWIFTSQPYLDVVAAQADFSALVTADNPAQPGSLIHFWLTGLGPLNIPVPTGVKGPSNPPAVPSSPLACYLSNPDANQPAVGLRLPTVIYAPNLIGVYQVDAWIPDSWPAGKSTLSCKGATLVTAGSLPIGAAAH